jgi:2-methylisocitrate lyase-like PEP mutase family enzyme
MKYPSAQEKRARLVQLLKEGPLFIPGAFDGISARLVDEAGLPAVYVTGNGLSASLLGRPDIGLLSGDEVIAAARRIAAAISVPLIFDADTGYGGVMNVQRTVADFEGAGVAAIHIEDQVNPKQCGFYPGLRKLVPALDMVTKIKAAVEARTDPNFLIIARTDARRGEGGLDEAIARARACAAAGADLIFAEGVETPAETKAMYDAAGVPLMLNLDRMGHLGEYSVEELAAVGGRIIIDPGVLRYAFVHYGRFVLDEWRKGVVHGTAAEYNSLLLQKAHIEHEARLNEEGSKIEANAYHR